MKNIKVMKNKCLLVLCISLSFGIINAQDYKAIIKNFINQKKSFLFKRNDLTDFEIENVDKSKSLQSDIVKIQQTYNGLPIFEAVATTAIRADNVVYFNDNFQKSYSRVADKVASLDRKSAFLKAINKLNLTNLSDTQLIDFKDKEPGNVHSTRSRLIYIKQNEDLILAYEFIFPEKESSNYWDVIVDANTGEILKKINLTVSCTFNKDPYSYETNYEIKKNEGLHNKNQSYNFNVPSSASYNVFAFPVEAPTFGTRSIVTNPWDLGASPEGWHSNGVESFTYTKGNNVFAYNDIEDYDRPGHYVDGGVNLIFNSPYNVDSGYLDNEDAAITNLFYTNNMVHDITYKFGFNEAARNFQQNNFGKGGIGDDYVRAEAQDGGGTDNANFSTPPDGGNGRMQMYLWTPDYIQNLFYNSPSSATTRVAKSNIALFGFSLETSQVTADVAVASVLDGCTALPAGSLNSKIGLIERGNCTFTKKVKTAQDAGADAAIIFNSPTDTTLSAMSGSDSSITIPSILIGNAEGEYMKTLISNGETVNVTLKDDIAKRIYRDGSVDNGVIIHEYGHGVSTRSTGDGYSCLDYSVTWEQMGEGWSDFLALMLTNRPGDDASVARGMATFAYDQMPNGVGIRPARYSPNFSINNYTYGSTNGMKFFNFLFGLVPDVHSIGFVWATILWDLNWNYVAKYGYSSDVRANLNSGSARVLQLVMDGMKLQECNPTFVSGRDALLAADQISTGGENKCLIWKTFAKRGLGVNASAGSKTSIDDQVEDFTEPTECTLSTNDMANDKSINVYPNPAKNEFNIKFPQNIKGKINIDIYDATGKLVYFTSINPNDNNPISTNKFANGVYIIRVTGLDVEFSTKLIINK